MRDYRILVVDDDEMVRLAISMILTSAGYNSISAVDGLEALEMISAEAFDLIITDMKMPRAGGMEVLKAAKAKNPGTKVIVITGYAAEDPRTAISAGADDFIYKVFKREELLSAMQRLLP